VNNIHVDAFIEILKDEVKMKYDWNRIRPQRECLAEFQIENRTLSFRTKSTACLGAKIIVNKNVTLHCNI
jgi:hypothetical protein